MELLTSLLGELEASELMQEIKTEIPNMPDDFYVRNIIRTKINM